MTKFTTFGRFAAMAALVGSLGFAAANPAAAETHDYWTSVVGTDKGRPVCGVRTNMRDGGKLSLLVLNQEIHMVASDPAWRIPVGNTVVVTVSVDGDVFRGRATAADEHTLVLTSLTEAFVREFVDGSDMLADFGGVRWHVDLTGSSEATDDMINCVQQAGGGLTS